MSKTKIVILIAAIAAGVYLYTLPKGIIKKEENTVTSGAVRDGKQEAPADAMQKMHRNETSEKDKNSIKELTKKYLMVSNPEKKVIFADSLAGKYRTLHQYDSATKYIEIVAAAQASAAQWIKAGDYNFEAYSFSDSEGKEKYNQNARKYYNLALNRNAKDYEAKCKLAMTYVGSENPMQGIGLLKEVLKDDPKNETAIYQLGILSLQSGQNQKAVDRFKELIQINPANANAHYYLGVSLANTGDKDKAIASLERAKELETDKGFRAAVDDYLAELKSK